MQWLDGLHAISVVYGTSRQRKAAHPTIELELPQRALFHVRALVFYPIEAASTDRIMMKVLQGSGVQSPAAIHAEHKVVARSAIHAGLSVRPLSCQAFSLSSRNFNALSARIPVGSRRGGSRGVVVMGVEESYAAALANVAKAKDALEEVYSDVQKLNKYFSKPEIAGFFTNPVIDSEKKKEVFNSIAKEEELQAYTLNFLYILVDKKRINITPEILKAFENIYYKMTDTQIATVTSAVKIENDQLAQIAKKVQGLSGAKNVKIKNVIDTSVIAGFKVNYGDDGSLFIDLTIKGQLDRIAASMEAPETVGVA